MRRVDDAEFGMALVRKRRCLLRKDAAGRHNLARAHLAVPSRATVMDESSKGETFMADDNTNHAQAHHRPPEPNPALERLDALVGK